MSTSSILVADRLYGELTFSSQELRLFQTRELARLRHVSLSAVPPWSLPVSECATKFEHSLGVAHLARLVGQRPEFRDIARDLFFAALAHDLGTPPFSHVSELLQEQLLGVNHEEYVKNTLDNSEFFAEVKEQGGSLERIIAFVEGTSPPLSDLMNGSLDLDNLDNTLRFGVSTGLVTSPPYNPEILANALCLVGTQIALTGTVTKELKGWYQTRIDVYKFVNGVANSAPGMMLLRALSLAAENNELPHSFFTLNNSEALDFLLTHCSPRVQRVMKMMVHWQWYEVAYNQITLEPSSIVKQHNKDVKFMNHLAELLAKQLKTEPENVGVYIGKNKGFKALHLPVINDPTQSFSSPSILELDPYGKPEWLLQVYVHPDLKAATPVITEFMHSELGSQV